MNSIAQTMLAEFQPEAATTRRFLERLPESRLGWQAHAKSMTAGQLAFHLAEIPRSVLSMAMLDAALVPDFSGGRHRPATSAEILSKLDDGIAFVHSNLPQVTDARMSQEFKLLIGGKPVMAMPRVVFLRTVLLNHWYQHRGQFGVYLRLVGAKVPSSYGPSGDEAAGGGELPA